MKKAAEYYRLYNEISRLTKTQNKKHPMYYRKLAMKVLQIFLFLFMIGYLFCIGITLKDVLQSIRPGMEPYNLFNEGMCFLLIFDMLFRFMGQETPVIKAHPFLLLPIPRYMVMDCYLIRIALMLSNLLWLALLLPFAAKAILPFYGIIGCIGYVLGWWLILVLNSYFYLITRTLIAKCFLWILLPVIVYGSILVFIFLPGVNFMGYFFMYLGEGWMKWQPWSFLLVIAVIVLLFLLNRKVQMSAVYAETAGISMSNKKTPRIRTDFTLFNRFGVTGEFIKMEIKSAFRNKTVRTQMIMLVILTAIFSPAVSFAPDIYGNTGNLFWIYYCFYMLTTPLLHTLGIEGNYMDGLMIRKQLLIDLLKGKYFFFCLLELIPLLLMIPAVVTQTITLGQWISYYLMAIGFIVPVTLQTAPYTNYCQPMNQKLTAGSSQNNVGMTFLWMGCIFILPIGIKCLVTYLISDTASYLVLSLLGIAGFLTSSLWLTFLYKRIYLRRYRNMEGFRNSREH